MPWPLNHNPHVDVLQLRLAIRRRTRLGLLVATVALFFGSFFLYRYAMQHHDLPRFAGQLPEYAMQRPLVTCPTPGPEILVLVGMGQSNAGNWGEASTQNVQGHPDVLEYWQGNCYQATSPMLGGTGEGTALWPELGRLMIESGTAKQVVIQVFAVDGAPIQRFTRQDDLWPFWRLELKRLLEKYRVGYYLWLQGEADFALGTSEEDYIRMFGSLHDDIRELDPGARVFVPIQTYCADTARWTPDNTIAKAQAEIPKIFAGTLAGVHTDELLATPGLRWDGCHPSLRGYARWSAAWTTQITQAPATREFPKLLRQLQPTPLQH